MINYSPNTTYVFYQVDRDLPNILLAIRVSAGNMTYKVYGCSEPLTSCHDSAEYSLHPMELTLESAYALGLLYKRVCHWIAGHCSLDTALVNDSQFFSYYRVKEVG